MALAVSLIQLIHSTFDDALKESTAQAAADLIKWRIDVVVRLKDLVSDEEWRLIHDVHKQRTKRFKTDWPRRRV